MPKNCNSYFRVWPTATQSISHADRNASVRLAEWCPSAGRLPDIPGSPSNSGLGQPCNVGDRCSARGIGNDWRHCPSFVIFLPCSLSSIIFLLLKPPSNLHPCGQHTCPAPAPKQAAAAPALVGILMSNKVVPLPGGTSSLQEPQHRQEEHQH